MARIEVFADVVCPFTHVGLRRLHEARSTAEHPVALRVRAWPLELINGAPIAPELAAREIEGLRRGVAPELFAGFDSRTFPSTSIPAFGLAAAAYALDDAAGEAVSLAVRGALFEGGLDIADLDVLRAIGQPFGVEPLRRADAECAVRTDWERGKARHVQGSPHFFVGDRDWFCPSLEVSHDGTRFEVRVAEDVMRDFYTEALVTRADVEVGGHATTARNPARVLQGPEPSVHGTKGPRRAARHRCTMGGSASPGGTRDGIDDR